MRTGGLHLLLPTLKMILYMYLKAMLSRQSAFCILAPKKNPTN